MATQPTYPPYPQRTGLAAGGAAGGQGTTQGGVYYPSSPGQSGGQSDSGSDGSQFGGGVITINRQGFIKAYADMVARTWTDDSYLDLILSDTANALSKVGIPTVPGAVIRVIEHRITGSGKIEDQVDAWLEGNRTGLYDLFLPIKPDDFDATPGGGAVDGCAGGGCCCSPCCCCT